MKKNYSLFLFILLSVFSCGTDDNITPLNIGTNPDSVTIAQNSQIDVFIFSNDSNIPSSGQLTVSNPTKGNAVIMDSNNSPNNPSDDIIHYSVNPNEIGSDSFQYTICNASSYTIQ